MSHTPKSPLENINLNVPSMNAISLKELQTKRSSVKGRITKFKKYLVSLTESDAITPIDICALTQRLDKFRELYTHFEDLQSQIEILNASHLDDELDIRDEMEVDISILIAQAQLFIEKKQLNMQDRDDSVKSSQINCNHSCNHSNQLGFKLPTIKIANFDGTYFKWLEFRDTYISLIHGNQNIEPIHKFHYLNSYLEGEAASVISNLEITSANYEEAWRLLCERYNNTKQLINNHLNSLCNIQPMQRDSAKDLRFLLDHVSKNLRALNTLGEPTGSWDTLVIHLVSVKLHGSTSYKWEEFKNNFSHTPKLKNFFDFIKSRADILESINNNKVERQTVHKYDYPSTSFRKQEKSHVKSYVISARDAPPSFVCVHCNGSHRLYDCASFLAKTVKDRTSEAVRLKLCLNCLRRGHTSKRCWLGPCTVCKQKHNTLLHSDSSPVARQSSVHTTISSSHSHDKEVEQDLENHVVSMSIIANRDILLSTAQVKIFNPNTNKCLTIKALLDSGSQSSLITSRLKNELQLASQPTEVNILGVGNVRSSNSVERCVINLKSTTNNFETKLSCLVLPQISGKLPSKSIDVSQLKLPSDIKLADPTFNTSAQVDMLLGADIFWYLLESDQINLGPNQPIIRNTKLGWILAGPILTDNTLNHRTSQCNHIQMECDSNSISNDCLNENLTKFWELENFPSLVSLRTDEEQECEANFVQNTLRNEEGRFCVKLPLLVEPDCLGDSFKIAKRQFLALEKRFEKNPELKEMYSSFINEYLALGHMSRSDQSNINQSYFIPHHAVWKPSSESTKLKVVFNGSAKTTSGYSLNDIQMTGPHIQDLLFNILLRFRQHTYVISGDIKQMYRQVQMQECHRSLQTILWRNSPTDSLQSYKLNTVTYGLTSSSFLSTRCLWQLGEDCNDPKIKEIIQNDFLVDDLLTGSDNHDELIHIKYEVEKTLSAGGFPLRKYRSNAPSLLVDPQKTQCDLIISSAMHTLGVGWNPNEDYIHFPNNYKNNKENPSKRSILSDSCRIFDPLGLLSLLTITPKLIIQKLWLENIGWDEPIPEDIRRQWNNFITNIRYIQTLRIHRHVLSDSPSNVELHCFCDASKHAYAACIFLKSVNAQGTITVRLLCAKTRVAPVKPVTIPRLELCACVLGAQLAAAVCRTMRCEIARKVFWTDSSIVLCWLNMPYDKLKTFVSNRIGNILHLSRVTEWRHVPTNMNPADLASRGVEAHKVEKCQLWWNGPTFLQESEGSWPNLNPNKYFNNDIPDVKINVTTSEVDNTDKIIKFDKYSKLIFLQRTFAYLLRFINNCRNPLNKSTGALQLEEVKIAFKCLVKLSQAESFQKELTILRSNKILSSKSSIASLSPFLDDKGIIRVGGRLGNSCYSYEKRHPMLLHAKHNFTKLLFQKEHLRLLHAGPQLLLSSLRNFVWPVAGRNLARTTARQCTVCRKIYGQSLVPIMGMLPKQRVNPDFPFISTGVDFAGPFYITDRKGRGCKITKCYLCIFICFRYKCVHLEAVSELSKDAFILSLRRFISRRGKPSEIFCDNGRNFVAASKDLSDFLLLNSGDIVSFASDEGIKFKFQPAYAPHFGGLVESAVKSAKYHIKRVLGTPHLSFEELATLFGQIEAILNSRPLCPLSPSPDDYQSLTPGHFLIGRPLMSLPSPNFQDKNINRLDRFQRLETLRQHFWHRWQKEYIAELQQRHKWRTPSQPLQIGDLVLLKEDNVAPMQWKLGRITMLFPGQDGVARVAELKTSTGTFRRGTKYLCPLLDPDTSALDSKASKAPEDVRA